MSMLNACLGLLLAAQVSADPPAAPGAIAADPVLDAKGQVVLTWVEGKTVRLARFGPKGWSRPQTVVKTPELFGNWADFPTSVALGRDYVVSFLEKSGSEKYAYDVQLARGRLGRPFTRLGSPHDDGTPTEHGFVSLVRQKSGVQMFWLDGRGMPAGGPMTLRTGRLQGGKTVDAAVLDDRVCECCQTSAGITKDGPFVVYRDRSADEIRNINVVRKTKTGWSEPVAVHDDGWKIAGCPVNGPSTVARGAQVAVAWFTGADGGRVRLGLSKDSARSFDMVEISAGTEAPPLGRVDVVMTKAGVVVSWLAGQGTDEADIVYRHVGFDGRLGPVATLTKTSPARTSGFPRMVATRGGLMFFWTEVGETTLLRARLLPVLPPARGPGSVPDAPTASKSASIADYQAKTLEGASIRLADLRGKPVLVNLWATWCGPCRREIPELIRLSKAHPGLSVVGINVDEAGADALVAKFVRDNGVAYPVWRDPEDRASRLFRIDALPASFLLDAAGKIVFARRGELTADDPKLQARLRSLLRRRPK